RLRGKAAAQGVAPATLSIAYFGGDLPELRIPGAADLLESDAPPRRYLAVSRQILLLGPDAALYPDARPRVAWALDLLAREISSGSAGPIAFLVGDSIVVYDLSRAH